MKNQVPSHHPRLRHTPLSFAAQALCCGLAFSFSGVQAQENAPASDNTSAIQTGTLPAVTVKAARDAETATGRVNGLAAKRSATGTKTDTPINETPQSISVVTADQIDALKPQTVTEALAYTAGVAYEGGYGSVADSMYLRGFMMYGGGAYYRDGLKYLANNFDGRIEVHGLERLEVLKGAASVLYGTAAPGGIVNAVSKRPSTEASRELSLQLGSFDNKQLLGDFTGPLTDDGVWSYRLVTVSRKSDTFVDHAKNDGAYIAPSLTWRPDAATSLTLLADYTRSQNTYVNGLPAAGTLFANPNGKLPRSRFIGEPDIDMKDSTNQSFGYLLEKDLTGQLKLRHSARYTSSDVKMRYVYLDSLASDNRTITRVADLREESSGAAAADTSLQYKLSTGRIENTLLVGFDYIDKTFNSARTYRSAGNLDIYAPVYGAGLGPVVLERGWKSKLDQKGLYAQNQLKLDERWVFTLGGRHDSLKSDFAFVGQTPSATQEREFTGRAGVVYLAPNGLAPFFSISQSYEPTDGADRFGNPFKSTKGKQQELGLRYQPRNSDLLISGSIFRLTQTNVLKTDYSTPAPRFSMQVGEVRSQGLELEAKGKVSRHLSLLAAYAYTETETTRTSDPSQDAEFGKANVGIPKNTLALWGQYDLAALGSPGWNIAAGVRHVGRARGISDLGEDVTVPSRNLVDASVTYAEGNWKYALNASNLFDKTYVATCNWACFYGEPRKVNLTATYRW